MVMLCLYLKIKGKETKVALACLGEYLHNWRIIESFVCTVLQEQHLIRNGGLIASKYKLVNLKQIDKKR